jgi:hypothetical protein
MANKQAVCAYRVTARGGQTIATLAAEMASVPLDVAYLTQVGALPVSDVMAIVGQTATRTITLQFAPGVPATGTPVFTAVGPPAGAIILPLDNAGSNGDYARVPIITFPPSVPGPPPEAVATAQARMGVIDAIVVAGGSGYSSSSKAIFVGGELDPLGTPAAGTPTLSGGVVTGITFTNAGLGYQSFPQIQIVDPGGGRGALVFGGLSVQSVARGARGNYQTIPLGQITSYFQTSWPDGTNQAAAFANFMIRALAEGVRSPIVSVPPVIS